MLRSSHRGAAETNLTRTIRLRVRSLALLSGLRIWCCLSCGVGRRRGGSDPALLCVCATAPIQPLAWEHPYFTGAAQEMAKKTKKKKLHLFSV